MSDNITRLVVGVMTLALNYSTMFLILDRNFGRLVSFVSPVLFSAAYYVCMYMIGLQNVDIRFIGIAHLLVIVPLFKAQFFQKIFAFFLQMLVVGTQIFLSAVIAKFFVQAGGGNFNLFWILILLVMYSIYVILLHFFGRKLFRRMFIDGRHVEWAVYAFGAIFSYIIFVDYQARFLFNGEHGIIIVFAIWSFIILCFAIINTHEKSKQKYEAEFARDIISSGEDHYKKMNEMYDKLRVMRHDYKFHLDTINELLSAENKNEVEQYLTDVREQFSEKELPNFCSNPVLKALLASYAERCGKFRIKYSISISMPEKTIPNYEMCIVLGNLLENAVEACTQTNGERKIELTIKTQGVHFALMIKNSCKGEIIAKNGLPVNTRYNRGSGLRSVQAIAARYGGELITEWNENTFTVYVMLML